MIKKYFGLLLLLLSSILYVNGNGDPGAILVTEMICEGKARPMGVPLKDLHFGWVLAGRGRNRMQTGYQIILGRSPVNLPGGLPVDLPGRLSVGLLHDGGWNSGRITSSESIAVPYQGPDLKPGVTYYWKVRVWDQDGKPSPWSTVSTFTTGLFTCADWKGAKWIGYEELADSMRLVPGWHFPDAVLLGNQCRERSVVPLFRKSFAVNKYYKNHSRTVKSALVFVTGLGQYNLSVNGRRVGNHFLSPGWTDYAKRCLYNVYDVTGLLRTGENAMGLIVGNGFYNINRERYFKLTVAYGYPKMICLLKMIYSDGTVEEVVSDGSWKTIPSAITFSSIYGGEDYDATREEPGWASARFRDGKWKKALLVEPPEGKLVPETDFAVTVMDTLTVRKINRIGRIGQSDPGAWSYDFGQNLSGIIEVKVKGHRGDTVRLTPSELVDGERRSVQRASGGPFYFSYILKGEGMETWRPAFSYYGFRYVMTEYGGRGMRTGRTTDTGTGKGKDTGTGLVPILRLTALHTRNAAPPAGSFYCSNPLFSRINDLIRWAIRSNMQSVITDCPHREKLGWLEQDYLMGESIHYNYDIRLLYKNIVADMRDAQLANGLVPDIAPEYVRFDGGFRDSPEWGSASVILPWLLYKWYGDMQTLELSYEMMKRYVAYLGSKSKDHRLNYGLGDWYDYGPGFPGVAQLTPKELTATAIYYYDVDLMARIAAILNRPSEATDYLTLAAAIKTTFNNHFFDREKKVYSTGSQSAMAMPLCVGLVDSVDRQAVVRNLNDSIRASGYKLTAGDIGFHFLIRALSDNQGDETIYSMNNRNDVPGYGYQLAKGATALTESWAALTEVSNNHLMLGHIMEWFYSGIGGIRQEEQSTAYKRIIIDPVPVGNIHSATTRFVSPYGVIRSAWKKDGAHFRLHVDIPVNTTAVVYMPSAHGLKTRKEIGSGSYDLVSDW